MTLTELKRLNDAMLTEIARRLSSPMNDDGLRAWYRQDGNALLEEVIALRRERAAALTIFKASPPLEGIDAHTADLREVADRLAALWIDHQQGVWQRAEVKRIREKLAAAEQQVAESAEKIKYQANRILDQGEQIEQLQAQLADAIADGQREVSEIRQVHAEQSARVSALLAEAASHLQGAVE
jgi:hypothetical protein